MAHSNPHPGSPAALQAESQTGESGGERAAEPANLLRENRDLIVRAINGQGAGQVRAGAQPVPGDSVLDLACGAGRNGLYLATAGLPVVFADRNPEALQTVRTRLKKIELRREQQVPCETWAVDLEAPGTSPLAGRHFGAILVFNYLHRPLMASIKAALRPGGILLYETFTTAHAAFGRPSNPDFLLRPGELKDIFAGWQILHYTEEVVHGTDACGSPARAFAALCAIKPRGER